MKILQTFGIGKTPSQTTATFAAAKQRVTILDATNRQFLRTIVLSNDGVRVSRGTTSAGIAMADLFSALATLESALTWAPIITVQPVARYIPSGTGTAFAVTATSETDISYQWQKSTDSGATWGNQANTGVYTGATTATLTISDVASLGGNEYRCVVTNSSGSTNSTAGTLTTALVPSIGVTAPTATALNLTLAGPGTFTYQWQISSDGGSTWGNQANTGVYTGVTTVTLHISDSTGLNGKKYRVVISGTASFNSNVATLTVT